MPAKLLYPVVLLEDILFTLRCILEGTLPETNVDDTYSNSRSFSVHECTVTC